MALRVPLWACVANPEPDISLPCVAQLTSRVDPHQAAVVEDAIADVQAGRRGGFAFVLGVDRNLTGTLVAHGAWVIHDFKEITADQVVAFFADLGRDT